MIFTCLMLAAGPCIGQTSKPTVEESARAAVEIAKRLQEQIDALRAEIARIYPAKCPKSGQVPQWDGDNWSCIDVVTACRVCVQIMGNAQAAFDGKKECSNYSSLDEERATPISRWAEAGPGQNKGGKYAVKGWITCR